VHLFIGEKSKNNLNFVNTFSPYKRTSPASQNHQKNILHKLKIHLKSNLIPILKMNFFNFLFIFFFLFAIPMFVSQWVCVEAQPVPTIRPPPRCPNGLPAVNGKSFYHRAVFSPLNGLIAFYYSSIPSKLFIKLSPFFLFLVSRHLRTKRSRADGGKAAVALSKAFY
jgi:hypothetical protein